MTSLLIHIFWALVFGATIGAFGAGAGRVIVHHFMDRYFGPLIPPLVLQWCARLPWQEESCPHCGCKSYRAVVDSGAGLRLNIQEHEPDCVDA